MREVLSVREWNSDPQAAFNLLQNDVVKSELGHAYRQHILQQNERTKMLSKTSKEHLSQLINSMEKNEPKTCQEIAFYSNILSILQDAELTLKKGSFLAKQVLKDMETQSIVEMIKTAPEMLQLCTFFNAFGRSDVSDHIIDRYFSEYDSLVDFADLTRQTVILQILLSKELSEEENLKVIKLANYVIDKLGYLDLEELVDAITLLIERFPKEVAKRWKNIVKYGLFHLKLGQLTIDQLGDLLYAYKQFDVEEFWELASNCVWNVADVIPASALVKIIFAFGKQSRGSDEIWERFDRRLSECLTQTDSVPTQELWLAYFGFLLANYVPRHSGLDALAERVYSAEALDAMDVQNLAIMAQMQSKMTQISPKHKQLAFQVMAQKLGVSSLETLQKALNLKGK